MNTKTSLQLEKMLEEVYSRFGSPDNRPVEARIREAKAYLAADRKRYIEVAEQDVPADMITEQYGVSCKLIPLAREAEQKWVKNHTEEETVEYSVMVTETEARFVSAVSRAKCYLDPTRSSWTFPEYRYVELKDIPLRVVSPHEIRKMLTKRDRRCYALALAAFTRYCQDGPQNAIPHKTERAMLVMERTPLRTVQIGQEKIPGLLIPLAESDLQEAMRPDCRYSRKDELCLFVDVFGPQYLLKSIHNYSYFRKVICDDVPGGCIYEPTEEQQATTYKRIELEEAPEQMHPYFF